MRGSALLDKMELISPAYIELADAMPEKRKTAPVKWLSVAACICIIAAAASGILRHNAPLPPDSHGLPSQTEKEKTEEPFAAVFNEPVLFVDASRAYIPGYFTEKLSEEEITAITPEKRLEYTEYSGYAGFDGDGNFTEAVLEITTSVPECHVTAVISENLPPACFGADGEPVISTCGGVDFTVWRFSPDGKKVILYADADIGGCGYRFTLEADTEREDGARKAFQEILSCFSHWENGKPDLSAVTADSIPEFFDLELTLSEALADKDFGKYMLPSVPDGFTEEAVRRYRDQNNDYLSGLWTRGYDEISWRVSRYAERDASRLTGVDEPENYDLSLYPIPRADSVPDELREIVNDPIFDAQELTLKAVCARAYKTSESGDTGGWRMSFSVKYGDILVRITAKGAEPEWIYNQLKDLL